MISPPLRQKHRQLQILMYCFPTAQKRRLSLRLKWIPYQLSKLAEVTLHIYAVNGKLIRTLALGHLPAGMYQSKNRAVYWDGNNEVGERVASGVYFYTLTAGDFTATRKMLILK